MQKTAKQNYPGSVGLQHLARKRDGLILKWSRAILQKNYTE